MEATAEAPVATWTTEVGAPGARVPHDAGTWIWPSPIWVATQLALAAGEETAAAGVVATAGFDGAAAGVEAAGVEAAGVEATGVEAAGVDALAAGTVTVEVGTLAGMVLHEAGT